VAREFSEKVGIPHERDVLHCPHATSPSGVSITSSWLSRHYDNEYAVLLCLQVGYTGPPSCRETASEDLVHPEVMEEYERNRTRRPGSDPDSDDKPQPQYKSPAALFGKRGFFYCLILNVVFFFTRHLDNLSTQALLAR